MPSTRSPLVGVVHNTKTKNTNPNEHVFVRASVPAPASVLAARIPDISPTIMLWRVRWPSPVTLVALSTLLPNKSSSRSGPEILMGFPIRVAQADCGRPSLFCVADQNSFVVSGLFASAMEENRTFEMGSPALWVKAMPRWSSLGEILGTTLQPFRPLGPYGIKVLVVQSLYSNAKSPARGSEDGVRGALLAACVSASLMVEPFHPLYFRGQLCCHGSPFGKKVGPAALLSAKLFTRSISLLATIPSLLATNASF